MPIPNRNAPLSRTKLLAVALQGVCIGATFGYIFMAATQAVLEIGTGDHYSEETPAPVHFQAAPEKSSNREAGQTEGIQSGIQAAGLVAGSNTDGNLKVDWLDPREAKPISKSNEWPKKGNTIHVILTSNGSPYLNIQTRIMYSTFKLARKLPNGEKMVGFTRVLHRTKTDSLMDEITALDHIKTKSQREVKLVILEAKSTPEQTLPYFRVVRIKGHKLSMRSDFRAVCNDQIPSYRVEPQNPACDTWCEFPVADRPGAIRQFLEAASKEPTLIKAPWLLLIEADYVWKRPVQAPMAESSANAQGFPFGYIDPSRPDIRNFIRSMFPEVQGDTNLIPGTGPAPVLLRVEELRKVTPDWERLTNYIEANKNVKEALGWVREMYAFSISAALQKVKIDIRRVPENPLIVQPPADHELGNAAMYHYTWGATFLTLNDTKVFEFDKRVYVDQKDVHEVPRMPQPPTFEPGWHLQDGAPVTKGVYNIVADMLHTMNTGIATLTILKA